MSNFDLTANDLRKILSYDPDTGEMFWVIRPSRAVRAGDLAGVLDKKGYRTIGIRKRVYKAHRLAWLHVHGNWPVGLLDHINGNKSDNRLANLRVVDESGNSQNVRKPNRRNKSGFMGVIAYHRQWRANITIDGKTQWLGDFKTLEEAHAAYLEAKRKHHSACTI